MRFAVTIKRRFAVTGRILLVESTEIARLAAKSKTGMMAER